jgi:hypothetical protein
MFARTSISAASSGRIFMKFGIGGNFIRCVFRACCRYSDWLRAGWSGDRIPVVARISAPVHTGPGAHAACYTRGKKVKGFPLQAWCGSWGSRRLRLLDRLDFRHDKVVRSSPLRTGRLHPQEFSRYSYLESESTPGHMVPSVAPEKIPSDTTGDRSRDPPTSSSVP